MSKVSLEEGRKRVNRGVRRPMAEWDVLLKDQHEGYISWSEFERNQQVITDNATGKGSAAVKRRGGKALDRLEITADAFIRPLVNACEPAFRPLVQCALLTGCRYGEIVDFRAGDFDRDAGAVSAHASKAGR